ncbi:MAG TPA: RagB/SusD family nutrient uptake outer membrane protein [Puia sp.]
MKNTSIIIGVVCLGLLGGGCDKSLLNTSPKDQYVESNYWESPAAAQAGLSACYGVMTGSGLWGGDATPLFEEGASPNAYDYDNTMGFNLIAEGLQSASSSGIIPGRWKACYTGIGRCNTFLVKVDEVPMDGATKTRMKGEAYFLRALYYFTLENYYGAVPLILAPPDRATQTNVKRTNQADVVAKVLSDLDSAAAVLPLKYTGGDLGRATKGAALTLKAKLLLWEASPLFSGGNDAAKWQTAADAAQSVMNLGGTGYGLYSDYRGLFLPQNENNKEVIFDVQFIYPDMGNSFDLIDKQYNTNAPLLDIAQVYTMKNGLPITDPTSGYDPAHPYVNRDPRLYQTIVFPGDTFMTVPVTPSRFAITGFGLKKYSIYDKGAPPSGKSDLKAGQSETNYILLRYADVLLMYAEAKNEASGPDASVFSALNSVRSRAGLPDVSTALTQDSLRAVIRHERRVEFAGEGMYYNDIRRWKTAGQVLGQAIYKYDGSKIETRKFDAARDYWWPIPQVERDLNPALEQNSGY